MPKVKLITTDTLIYEIDQEDVNEGMRYQFKHKPADAAFKDPLAIGLAKIGHYRQVMFGWRVVDAYKGNIRHEFEIINYEEVLNYLQEWDKGKTPDPVEVELFLTKQVSFEFHEVNSRIRKKDKYLLDNSGGPQF